MIIAVCTVKILYIGTVKITLKIEQISFYNSVMLPKDIDGTANSVNYPNQPTKTSQLWL